MAKALPDAILDAPLDAIAAATRLSVCSGQPADYAGIAAVRLASGTVDSGDFSKADGSPNGRTLTVNSQTGLSVTATGNATHICLDDGSSLLAVTTCPSESLSSGNLVDTNPFSIRVADPT